MNEIVLNPGQVNPYLNDPLAQAIGNPKIIVRGMHEFTEIKYSFYTPVLDRVIALIKALALTIFTAFIALFFEGGRALWSEVFSNKEPITVLIPNLPLKDEKSKDATSSSSHEISSQSETSSVSESDYPELAEIGFPSTFCLDSLTAIREGKSGMSSSYLAMYFKDASFCIDLKKETLSKYNGYVEDITKKHSEKKDLIQKITDFRDRVQKEIELMQEILTDLSEKTKMPESESLSESTSSQTDSLPEIGLNI